MRELLRRLWFLWNRGRLERELAEEIACHRELMAADGRTAPGDELRLREDVREVWGWDWLDRLRQDLIYGARVLRGAPGFTVTAMLVLALGIGVPLTAFRVALAELQGGPVPDPATLVRLTRRAPGVHVTTLSYPELVFYAGHARSFRSVIGLSQRNPAVFSEAAGGAPEPIHVTFSTSNLFAELGIAPALGRVLTPGDERPDAEPAAVLGESFWRRRLGGDPAAIGRTIRVNGKPLRVVGVLPRSPRARDEVWMPLVRQPYVIEGSSLLTGWSSALDLYGRLRPGVSPQASQEETQALAAVLRERWPDVVREGERLEARPVSELDLHSEEFRMALTSSALVLLILVAASANLGTLALARGVAREREIRVRMALGAARLRIVRQLFTESLLLAMISALCALLLSTVVLKAIQLQHDPEVSLVPDLRALAATFLAAILAALVFGLLPAFRLASLAPRAGRSRTIFLGAQVAVSCLLLVVSSLLVNSRQRLRAAEPGFDHRHLLSISPGLKAHGYGEAAAQAYLDLLRARASAWPDVKATSQVWLAPWGDFHMEADWMGRRFAGNRVDPLFLDTMGIRLLRGRNVQPGEDSVAMVNEAAARVLWPGQEALGQQLPWSPPGQTVVGVVGDASTAYVGRAEPLEFYLPPSPADAPESVLLVRVSGSPRDSVRRLHEAARALDGRLQPAVQVVTDAHDREMSRASAALAVIGILGTVAILLSVIGLAGLAGYTVAQRTREIGVRIALGARAGHIVLALLAPMSRPIVAGFVCGALGGAAVASVLRTGIPALSGLDVFAPLPYVMALAFFAVVVGLSILAPGRRALRIDPRQALQHE
ncbi:MAG TPA: ABC transporter permease [Candidatus Polarisedimenticolia bacterium]|nr:ABC transporter permease [Candidatus Polarisedimenticolia bacterium]